MMVQKIYFLICSLFFVIFSSVSMNNDFKNIFNALGSLKMKNEYLQEEVFENNFIEKKIIDHESDEEIDNLMPNNELFYSTIYQDNDKFEDLVSLRKTIESTDQSEFNDFFYDTSIQDNVRLKIDDSSKKIEKKSRKTKKSRFPKSAVSLFKKDLISCKKNTVKKGQKKECCVCQETIKPGGYLKLHLNGQGHSGNLERLSGDLQALQKIKDKVNKSGSGCLECLIIFSSKHGYKKHYNSKHKKQ